MLSLESRHGGGIRLVFLLFGKEIGLDSFFSYNFKGLWTDSSSLKMGKILCQPIGRRGKILGRHAFYTRVSGTCFKVEPLFTLLFVL